MPFPLKDKEEYEGVFVHAEDIKGSTALNPVLIVVDTHIPHLVADPTLLERVHQVVIIDHHRRSENFIKSPLLVYIEPGASSTSELIRSVKEKLFVLPDETVVYPGHGEVTTIGHEKLYNPFII